jgi:hypothetical protein
MSGKAMSGLELRLLRRERNVTQRVFARLLDTTVDVVCDWERGRRPISAERSAVFRAVLRTVYLQPRTGGRVSFCDTRQCGHCRSCEVRRRWREGVYARAPERRWNAWTPAEDARLRGLAGTMYADEIAAILDKEFRTKRTQGAVQMRAQKLDVVLCLETWWSLSRVGRLFGLDGSSDTIVRNWVATGLLPAEHLPRGRGCWRGEWRVAQADLETFIRTRPWAYDAAQMRPRSHPLAQLGRDLQRRNPWVTTEDVARYTGIGIGAVRHWVKVGVVPHHWRGINSHGGMVVISAALLPQIADLIAGGRRESEARRRTTFAVTIARRNALRRVA